MEFRSFIQSETYIPLRCFEWRYCCGHCDTVSRISCYLHYRWTWGRR